MIDLVRGAGGGPRVGSRSGVELETFPASIGPCANLAVTRLLDYGDGEFSDVDLFAGGPQLEHQRLNSNGGALGGLVCDAGDCGQQLDVYGRAQTTCMSPSSKPTPAPTTVGGAVSHGATSLTTLIACSRAAVQCAEPNVAKSSRLKDRSGDHQVYSHAQSPPSFGSKSGVPATYIVNRWLPSGSICSRRPNHRPRVSSPISWTCTFHHMSSCSASRLSSTTQTGCLTSTRTAIRTRTRRVTGG